MLLSGILSAFLIDHMLVSPAVYWILVPTKNTEEDDNEDEEHTSGHSQAGDDHCKYEEECKNGAKLF